MLVLISTIGMFIFAIGMVVNLRLLGFIISTIGLVVFFVPILLIGTYLDWIVSRDAARPVITFKQFIIYYNAAPHNWTLSRYYALYNGDVIDFKTFFDYIGYKTLLKKIEKRELKDKQLKSQLKFIKSVQKDINKQYEDITEFVKEGVIRY